MSTAIASNAPKLILSAIGGMLGITLAASIASLVLLALVQPASAGKSGGGMGNPSGGRVQSTQAPRPTVATKNLCGGKRCHHF